MAAEYEITNYENEISLQGNSSSRLEGICKKADLADVQQLFLMSADGMVITPLAATMKCVSFTCKLIKHDPAMGMTDPEDPETAMRHFTAKFIPIFKLRPLIPDLPFLVRVESSSEAFTTHSEVAYWQSDGSPFANSMAQPMVQLAVDDIVLYGSRSVASGWITSENVTVNGETITVYKPTATKYAAYRDKVSSDVFMGYAAGCVRWCSLSAGPRMNHDGTFVMDIEIKLKARSVSWLKVWREDAHDWDTILFPTNVPLLASTAFSGILTL